MSHPHRIHFSVHFSRTRDASPPSQQLWLWYATAAVGFFLVPAVGTGWLGLQPDLYYLGYFTVAVVFFTAFVTRYADALKELWTLHLWQTVVLGAVVGGGRLPAAAWRSAQHRP